MTEKPRGPSQSSLSDTGLHKGLAEAEGAHSGKRHRDSEAAGRRSRAQGPTGRGAVRVQILLPG